MQRGICQHNGLQQSQKVLESLDILIEKQGYMVCNSIAGILVDMSLKVRA